MRLESLKSSSYSKLNKEWILTPPIPSGFVAPKLALRPSLSNLVMKWIGVDCDVL
jgi:hypothetical protein